MATTRPTADPFEIAIRNWAAHERIIGNAHALMRIYDLDPELVEGLRDAYRQQDLAAWDDALARFLEALAEAKTEEDYTDG